jgi:glutamate-1-semialdehyde 2,1-aminomutase
MKSKAIKAGKGQKLWKKAKTLIPGGNQLLSKRAEMFLPDNWPAYFSKAKGAYVWDLDGNKYLDMCIMGIGACMLGYADPDVNAAVKKAIDRGQMATLNDPAEVELAELLCKLHPWADMVRYARAGGEAMAVAVRIARAYTKRDTIAFCGYHGWADWYLATNLQDGDKLAAHLLKGLEPAGVPKGLKGTVIPFHYNRIEELEAIVREHPDLAAIVMEPIHGEEPKDDFLKKVRAIADKIGAVLVFDEITMGFRLTLGGAHKLFGVEPDMAVFAKGMANGFAMAAIIGRREVMQAAQDSFISSTNWTESIGPVAAIATIKKMKKIGLAARLARTGRMVRKVWESAARKHGLAIKISGVDPLLIFAFIGEDGQVAKTVFVQEMLRRGFLASNLFYASYAHTPAHVRSYGKAVDEVFRLIADARKKGKLQQVLEGPVAHTGFQRLN